MKRRQVLLVSIIAAITLAFISLAATLNFQGFNEGEIVYVATTGNDSNTGAIDSPLLTLSGAKAKVRSLKTGGETGNITVYFRAGRYFQDATVDFSAQDSGSTNQLITYASYPGETAIITGAKTISGFTAITDGNILSRLSASAQANAKVVNLPSLGITDYGTLQDRGGFLPTKTAALELFFNDNRMQLARYPNSGWDYLGSGTSGVTNGFEYTDTRPASWPTYDDVFVSGLFSNTWADETYKIGTLNTTNKTITIAGTPDSYGFRAGQWFFYNNVLDELDAEGEYYLDRSTGNLYFWPPSDPATATMTVSLKDKLVGGNNLSYVRFQGISFQGTRSMQVEISNSNNLKLSNSSFMGAGNDAVKLYNVTNTIITNNTFSQDAERGLYIIGGDRNTLVSSGNVIINNVFHDTGQTVRSGKSSLEFSGVGMKIIHNEFYNIPQISVRMHGNDNLVSYNYFHDSVTLVPPNNQTADTGVVYIGRDYTEQGNVVSNNKFIDIGEGHMISGAVYLDDVSSGILVENNFFNNVGRSLMLGGGRYNTFRNNVVVNSTKQMVFDSRGYQSPTRSEWMANKFYNPISDASNTTPIIITTTNLHGLSIGSVTAPPNITVTDVSGNTAANGTWSYEIISTNQLRLLNSVGNGDFTGGGDMRSIYGNLDFYAALDAVHYPGSPYDKYPHIFDYTKYDLGNPVGNSFTSNILYFGSKAADTWVNMYPSTPPFFSPENNIVNGSNGTPAISGTNITADPQFVNPASGDYHLKSTSPALGLGFTELLYEKMGRYTGDQLLKNIPDQSVIVSSNLSVAIEAPYFVSDEAVSPIITVSGLPTNAVYDSATKRIIWTPASEQVGTYQLTVDASDSYLSATDTFSIEVKSNQSSGGTTNQNNSADNQTKKSGTAPTQNPKISRSDQKTSSKPAIVKTAEAFLENNLIAPMIGETKRGIGFYALLIGIFGVFPLGISLLIWNIIRFIGDRRVRAPSY